VQQGLGLTLGCVIASTASAEPLQTFRDCDVCPEMIELPMGEFLMGAPEGDAKPLVWRGKHAGRALFSLLSEVRSGLCTTNAA
jgi:formylglycine-generating enzyme required for sulfatase activity